MLAPYTSLDKCVGRGVRIRCFGEEYEGMLAGVYAVHGAAILVIAPMNGGVEQHIPLSAAVVTVRQS